MPDRYDDTEEKLRDKSASDKVKGKINEVIGKGRGKLGDLTDNGSEHIKGKAQELKGKFQQAKGDVEEDVADELTGSRNRRVDGKD